MTLIKICGITNAIDAGIAVELGVDVLGFNFYKGSPRYIDPRRAVEVVGSLNAPVANFGVFVNERMDTLVEIITEVPLDGVQLHGDESGEFISELRDRVDTEIIKAVRVRSELIEGLENFGADGILLDSYSQQARGGTGEVFDWSIARSLRPKVKRLWLAGGLAPGNVCQAIAEVSPYAVDVCSSIESSPGVKDPEKLKMFVSEVRSV